MKISDDLEADSSVEEMENHSFPEDEDMEKKRRIRKLIEEKLEEQKLKKELQDDFDDMEDEFDWDNND